MGNYYSGKKDCEILTHVHKSFKCAECKKIMIHCYTCDKNPYKKCCGIKYNADKSSDCCNNLHSLWKVGCDECYYVSYCRSCNYPERFECKHGDENISKVFEERYFGTVPECEEINCSCGEPLDYKGKCINCKFLKCIFCDRPAMKKYTICYSHMDRCMDCGINKNEYGWNNSELEILRDIFCSKCNHSHENKCHNNCKCYNPYSKWVPQCHHRLAGENLEFYIRRFLF